MEDNVITLVDDDGNEEFFFVVEETKQNGFNYLLISDADENAEEGDAYILKDVSKPEDEEAIYEFVEDDEEFASIAEIFNELMDEDTELV